MENYKIKVNGPDNSAEIQDLFFELGYVWLFSKKDITNLDATYIYAKDGVLTAGFNDLNFAEAGHQELTLPQLRDLVVLHRNDVKDANYLYGQNLVLKLETQDYKIWATSKLEWVDYIGSQTDLRNSITPIQLRPKAEQGLISGADVPRLIKDGQQVQLRAAVGFKLGEWKDLVLEEFEEELTLGDFINSRFEWRLKPRTIKLELEIPAPFEPKVGEEYFYLNSGRESGYAMKLHDGKQMDFMAIQFGAWRTEEEIKQVVAALRGIKG
nr:hypothetical protein [uncultured Acinetobacter sp.]